MFTVIIAEKEHIDAIQQENKLFFEPFLESKELAFCYWEPTGQNLYDSVPGLLDAVGRKKDWRAVVINNYTPETLKTQNPFDVVDNSGIASLSKPNALLKEDEPINEWENSHKAYYASLTEKKEALYRSAMEHSLQKLCTWLCFKPENYVLNDVKEKQDAHDWAMEQLKRDDLKPSSRLELLERDQYKNELRIRETLRREFIGESILNIANPVEIYCISPRTSDSSFFDPDTFWNVRTENEYSAFAERNMYFDKMRFIVFDLLPKTHRNYRTDYIRFLASVLVFASNPVPGSAMQARRLYHFETETDDTPLCTLVTSYDKKLESTSDVIDNEIEKIRSEIPADLTDKAAESMFCTPTDLVVALDESCNPEKVFAEKDYGLFFDLPENEFHKWNRDYHASEKELAYIIKQQSRFVKKSVAQANFASEISDVNVSRLTSLQLDDIRDYTDAAENEMVDSIPTDTTDASQYTEKLATESENVKKIIEQRMTAKTTMILGAFCLTLFVICFLPFLLSNKGSPQTIATAVTLTAVMLGALATVMLVTLFFLRMSVKNAVKAYNNTANTVMNEIMSSMAQISKYLSASCNVRRGHAVERNAKNNVDVYTKNIRIRKKHQEDIRKKRAYLNESYKDYFADKSFCDEAMSRPYDYDFDQRTEYSYPAPFLAGDCRQIEFICNGNFVSVPSSYVTRILVRMEGIYDE